jgi:hypothetical protein
MHDEHWAGVQLPTNLALSGIGCVRPKPVACVTGKSRTGISRVRTHEALRAISERVIGKLPESLQSGPDVIKRKEAGTRRGLTLVHSINRHNSHWSHCKDGEFSRTTVDGSAGTSGRR